VTEIPANPNLPPSTVEEFALHRKRNREAMGGAERIARIHRAGLMTARERISALLDRDSFREIGTFAASSDPAERDTTPADGRVAGFGRIASRPIGIIADDATVKGASASAVNIRKADRIFEQSLKARHPLVFLGETRGSRIPESLGSDGLSLVSGEAVDWTLRRRTIPLATVITGPSFGGSTFIAAMSDFVVQLRGATLAVVSPRIIEIATGERTDMDSIGGADLHATVTGQNDRVAETEEEAFALVREWLSYLPASCYAAPPVAPPAAPPGLIQPSTFVPNERRSRYDVRKLLAEFVDGGVLFEMKSQFGRSLITSLARIDGYPVAILASDPNEGGGALDPAACDKGTRHLCLADAFGLPVVIFHDSPGFYVGSKVEAQKIQSKTVLFLQALLQCSSPRFSVIIRKSFGLSYTSLGGAGTHSDLLVAWPGAEIGFMDPEVAANAMHGDELAALSPAERRVRRSALAARYRRNTDPFAAARTMALDEIIHPDETREVLVEAIRRHASAPAADSNRRTLRDWPTCW
jgi:acetyl-CoA carboxylase carboxyltransferase component